MNIIEACSAFLDLPGVKAATENSNISMANAADYAHDVITGDCQHIERATSRIKRCLDCHDYWGYRWQPATVAAIRQAIS